MDPVNPTKEAIKEANDLKLEANKAFAKQEYKKAAKIYRDALKIHFNPVLLSNRAMCFIKLKDWDRAIRDCSRGIEIAMPDDAVIVKLWYRKGIAHVGRKDIPYHARTAFQTTLQHDPKNTAALQALDDLNSTMADIPVRIRENANWVSVPMEVVEELPNYYQSWLKKEKFTEECSKEPSERASREIEQMFAKTKAKSESKEPKNSPHTRSPSDQERVSFTRRRTMHYLSTLSNLSHDRKFSAYQYVLELPPLEYKEIFEAAGMDSDFLGFFMEAASLYGHNNFEHWKSIILDHLETFSTLPRYRLGLLMCSKENINKLLSLANGDVLYERFKRVLL